MLNLELLQDAFNPTSPISALGHSVDVAAAEKVSIEDLVAELDDHDNVALAELEGKFIKAKDDFTTRLNLFEEENLQIEVEREQHTRTRGSLYDFLFDHKYRMLGHKKDDLQKTISESVLAMAADAKTEGHIDELEEVCFEQNEFLQSISLPITRILS
jgi:hypothetical protein